MRAAAGPKSLANSGSFCTAVGPPSQQTWALRQIDVIAFGHHHVQVVAHHEDAAAVALADGGNQFVQLHLAMEIHGLHGFIQHQQLRLAQQGAGQQHALQFAAGQVRHPCVDEVGHAGFGKGGGNVDFGRGECQVIRRRTESGTFMASGKRCGT
jgi:hypothetical protein